MRDTFILYVHLVSNGKVYIGITSMDVKLRWGNNGYNYRHNRYFYRAIQKYGWENIKHIVLLENLSKELACECEKYLIAKFQTNISEYGYNLSSGGEYSAYGMHHSEETKQHLSEVLMGRYVSDETRRKLSEANTGKIMSDEQKQKLRSINLGKKLSEETKHKISEGNKGLHSGKKNGMYGKVLRGAKNGMYGKHHTQEFKQYLSKINSGSNNHFYGKHHTAETKQKLSESHKGKHYGKQSEEHIRKRVEARRRTLELKKKINFEEESESADSRERE